MNGSKSEMPVHLSVVLPVFNGEPYLSSQLSALAAQVCSFPWELIVVDNGSTDTSAETARGFQKEISNLQVLSESRIGRAFALNTGVQAAVGEMIVLVDADDEVGHGYLEAMSAGLEKYEMVSARMDSTLLNPQAGDSELLPPDQLVVFLDYLPYIAGALIGMRVSVWHRLGGFTTDMKSGEDVDFLWRAYRLGISMGMVPDAVLYYRRPPTPLANFRKARSYGRTHVWLYLRYRSLGQPRLKIKAELHHVKQALLEFIGHKDHWQWRMAWHLGLVEGRLEESMRRRVWYP